jgi:hypothetical protein
MPTKRETFRMYFHQDGGKVYSGDQFTARWAAKGAVNAWNEKYRLQPPQDGSAFYEPVED